MLKVGGFLELKLRALRLMSTGFFIVCVLSSCKNAGWIWEKTVKKIRQIRNNNIYVQIM